MHIFIPFLQGNFGILVTFQLIAVNLLLFFLVMLILRRMKERSEGAKTSELPPAGRAQSSQKESSVAPAPPPPPISVASIPVTASPVEQASEPIVDADHKQTLEKPEAHRLSSNNEDALALLEKIDYLETKLVEAQIVQKELMNLHEEHKKLKEQLKEMNLGTPVTQGEPSVPSPGAPASPPGDPSSVASVNSVPSDGQPKEEISVASGTSQIKPQTAEKAQEVPLPHAISPQDPTPPANMGAPEVSVSEPRVEGPTLS